MSSDPRIPRNPPQPLASAEDGNPKSALRKQLLATRRALDADTRAQWDRALCGQVLAWQRQSKAAVLGVYWPLSGEPDLNAAYAELARRGVRLLLPVVVSKDAALEFAHWRMGEAMVKDKMGVAVPADLRMEAYPPTLLVPCLGFNRHGYRLGYGGGFYDRTLARAPRPETVGIAYSCLQADFAEDAHDVALDTVLTELAGYGSA